jgi:hypothetical protein
MTMTKGTSHLSIRRTEGEASSGESGSVRPTRTDKLIEDCVEIKGGGREVADTEYSEHLATRLEVLPWRSGATTEDELKGEGSSIPWLVRERGLLLLGVKRGDGGEVDAGVARDQRGVLAEVRGWDRAPDGKDGDADLAGSLYAHVRLHCRRKE